ncbi:hypothetical protein D021_1120B, partial [Vibrio parahaemolyticus 10296]
VRESTCAGLKGQFNPIITELKN